MPITDEAIQSLGVGPTELTPEQRVQKLLETLDLPKAEEPKQFGRVKGSIAALGDALTAMASVRAGGRPPAIGVSTLIRQQRLRGEEARIRESDAARRDIGNRLRIGVFQQSEQRRVQAEDDAANRAATAEADKVRRGQISRETFRSDMRKRIVDLGIDTGDTDLLTASDEVLKGFLDSHDPNQALELLLEGVPDDMEVVGINKNAKGGFSITTKPRKDSEGLSTSQLMTLAKNGVDISQLSKNKPLVDALDQLQEKANQENDKDTSLRMLEGFNDMLNNLNETSSDPDNVFGADHTKDLLRMRSSDATDDEVIAFYNKKVDDVAILLEEGAISPEQADGIVLQLRQFVRIGWKSLELPAVPRRPAKQEPFQPTVGPFPQTALGRVTEGFRRAGENLVGSLSRDTEAPPAVPEPKEPAKPGALGSLTAEEDAELKRLKKAGVLTNIDLTDEEILVIIRRNLAKRQGPKRTTRVR